MSEKTEKLVNELDKMNKDALYELGCALERLFGVSTQPAFIKSKVVNPPEEIIEEQSEFDVILHDFGNDKMKVILLVRQLKQLGLKDSKDLVETKDAILFESVEKDFAKQIVKKLTDIGANVSMQ